MPKDIINTWENASIRQLQEKYGRTTVREAISSTTGVILPQMVDAMAEIQLQTLVRVDDYTRTVNVAPGSGTVFQVQKVATPTGDQWTEGSVLTAADPTLGSITGTLVEIGKVTAISDLLAESSAIDFAETIGRVHANAYQQKLNALTMTESKLSTTNQVTLSGAGEQDYTFDNIKVARQKVMSQRFPADTFLSSPKKFYTFVGNNFTVVQFTGALASFVQTGSIAKLAGMDTVLDPGFGETFTGAVGEVYASVLSRDYSVAVGRRGELESEVWRDTRALTNYIVTSATRGAKLLDEKSLATIQHA